MSKKTLRTGIVIVALMTLFLTGFTTQLLAVTPQIAAGFKHSLALQSDGTVWAWGDNSSGQLGIDSTTPQRAIPVQVSGVAGVTVVAAGSGHSLALQSDGTVWAWGDNSSGQLGIDVSTTQSATPVQVAGLSGVVIAIAAGEFHSLALKSDGTIWAWGDNSYGQLGIDMTTTQSATPVQVTGLSGVVTAIAAGEFHNLARQGDGTVWGWGDNSYGQLGNIDIAPSAIPLQVAGLAGVANITAGAGHSLALKSDGTVWAWGDNSSGQLGYDMTLTQSATPLQVAGLSGVRGISAGFSHSLALKSDGTVWAWGGNGNGQLGNASTTDSPTPLQVSGVARIVSISAGGDHSVALQNDGTVWSWGDNSSGQLGNDNAAPCRTTPVQVTGLSGMLAVAAGSSHSLALKSDGTVWSWGYNGSGQLGDGTSNTSPTPVQVTGLSAMVAVAAGSGHSLALKGDGTVWSWGGNGYGQLGNGTTTGSTAPVQVAGVSAVTMVTAGTGHSLALKSDGTVWSWGYNYSGQLGNGSTANSAIPVQVAGLSGAYIAVAAGGYYSLALKNDGTVWSWGFNGNGQLGNGGTANSSSPVQVPGLTGVISIAAGNNFTLALKSDGTVWSWGYNGYGQLGNGTSSTSSSPVQVTGLSGMIAVAAGTSHSLALKSDATVWSWGYNGSGQLGNGTTNDSSTALQVTGLNGVTRITAGSGHSQALKNDATIWSWGDNNTGELGIGWTQVQSLVNLGAQQYALNVSLGGSGSGSVNSNPGGINCPGGSCSANYLLGDTVTLLPTAANGSVFAGWNGTCSGSDACIVSVDSTRNITVIFDIIPNVRIDGMPQFFGLLQPAVDAAASGARIQAKDVTLAGNLVLDQSKSVTIEGGYDATFASRTGYTILQGTLTLRGGRLVADHLVIR